MTRLSWGEVIDMANTSGNASKYDLSGVDLVRLDLIGVPDENLNDVFLHIR